MSNMKLRHVALVFVLFVLNFEKVDCHGQLFAGAVDSNITTSVKTAEAKPVEDYLSNVQSSKKWWESRIIYQIYTRSFKDTNGDGNGDFNGIIEKLPYLKRIGVGAIWICTMYKSPMVSYGYDVTDYKNVDPMFGTLQEFKSLLKEAHAIDILVIIDLIPNHSSSQHPWFLKSRQSRNNPYSDYYIWVDGKWNESTHAYDPPNNWDRLYAGHSPWYWSKERQQFYYGVFAENLPDLNLRNEKVVQELFSAVKFWIDFGVDGFRVDAVPYLYERKDLQDEPLNPEFDPTMPVSHLNREVLLVNQENLPEVFNFLTRLAKTAKLDYSRHLKDSFIVTEAYGAKYKQKYYQTGITFPFNMMLAQFWNENTTTSKLKELIDIWLSDLSVDEWPNWVLSNHDKPRVATRLGGIYEFNHWLAHIGQVIVLLSPIADTGRTDYHFTYMAYKIWSLLPHSRRATWRTVSF